MNKADIGSSPSTVRSLRKRLRTARQAALKAGRLIRSSRVSELEVNSKGRNDVATEMDGLSERLIVSYLAKHFPEDRFLGEEGGMQGEGRCGLWIIDPIDGTDNFIHGLPNYTVSIGYRDTEGILCVGIVYNPLQCELFSAARGLGAFLNGKPIRVSEEADPAKAISITSPPLRMHDKAPWYFKLAQYLFLRTWDERNFGSAALHLAYLACGRVEGFYVLGLKLYDMAGGLVILTEAGGRYSSLFENEDVLSSGNLLATNGTLHNWYLDRVRACDGGVDL